MLSNYDEVTLQNTFFARTAGLESSNRQSIYRYLIDFSRSPRTEARLLRQRAGISFRLTREAVDRFANHYHAAVSAMKIFGGLIMLTSIVTGIAASIQQSVLALADLNTVDILNQEKFGTSANTR